MRNKFPIAYSLYLGIAEPRFHRILQFIVYLGLLTAGVSTMVTTPKVFDNLVGMTLLYIEAGFLVFGSILGSVAVLPGIWWLERIGVLAITTALLMFGAWMIFAHASLPTIVTLFTFVVTFIQRYFEINKSLLAPE